MHLFIYCGTEIQLLKNKKQNTHYMNHTERNCEKQIFINEYSLNFVPVFFQENNLQIQIKQNTVKHNNFKLSN